MNYSLCDYIGSDGSKTANTHIIEYNTAKKSILCAHNDEKHKRILQLVFHTGNVELANLINNYNASRGDGSRGYLETQKFRLLLAHLKNNNYYNICGQCISTLY